MSAIPMLQMMVAALAAMVILLAEHYWLKRARLHPVWNYVLGCLAMWIPLSILVALWQLWMVLAALWSIMAAGGLAVMSSYLVDAWLSRSLQLKAAEREGQDLRREVDHGAQE